MTKFHYPDAIIETEWLEAHLDDPSMRIFDCTTHLLYDAAPPGQPYGVKSGREDFDRGHIPGASFLDLQSELSTSDSPYSFTLPSAEHFSRAMEHHGGHPAEDRIKTRKVNRRTETAAPDVLRALCLRSHHCAKSAIQALEGRACPTSMRERVLSQSITVQPNRLPDMARFYR